MDLTYPDWLVRYSQGEEHGYLDRCAYEGEHHAIVFRQGYRWTSGSVLPQRHYAKQTYTLVRMTTRHDQDPTHRVLLEGKRANEKDWALLRSSVREADSIYRERLGAPQTPPSRAEPSRPATPPLGVLPDYDDQPVTLLHPCHGDTCLVAKQVAIYGSYVRCPTCSQWWETWVGSEDNRQHWATSSLGMTVTEWHALEDRVRSRKWPEHEPAIFTIGLIQPP